MCGRNFMKMPKPFKKGYKVICVERSNDIFSPVRNTKLEWNQIIDSMDNLSVYSLLEMHNHYEDMYYYLFKTLKAARHYLKCMKDRMFQPNFKIVKIELHDDVYQGYADNSFNFDIKKHPFMYTCRKIKILNFVE